MLQCPMIRGLKKSSSPNQIRPEIRRNPPNPRPKSRRNPAENPAEDRRTWDAPLLQEDRCRDTSISLVEVVDRHLCKRAATWLMALGLRFVRARVHGTSSVAIRGPQTRAGKALHLWIFGPLISSFSSGFLARPWERSRDHARKLPTQNEFHDQDSSDVSSSSLKLIQGAILAEPSEKLTSRGWISQGPLRRRCGQRQRTSYYANTRLPIFAFSDSHGS